eukprot:136529_1
MSILNCTFCVVVLLHLGSNCLAQKFDCRYINLNNALVHPLDECIVELRYPDADSNQNPRATSKQYICNTENSGLIQMNYNDPYCTKLNVSTTIETDYDFNCESLNICTFAQVQYWLLNTCDSPPSINDTSVSQEMPLVIEDHCFSFTTTDGTQSVKHTCTHTSVTISQYNDNECRDTFKKSDSPYLWINKQCTPYTTILSTQYYWYSDISYCGLTDSIYTPYEDYLKSLDCLFAYSITDFNGATPLSECLNNGDENSLSYTLECNVNKNGIIKRSYQFIDCKGTYTDTDLPSARIFNCNSINICPMTKAKIWTINGQCNDGLDNALYTQIALVIGPNGNECFSDGNKGMKVTCNNNELLINHYDDYKCNDIALKSKNSFQFLDKQCIEYDAGIITASLYTEISQCDEISNVQIPTPIPTIKPTNNECAVVLSGNEYIPQYPLNICAKRTENGVVHSAMFECNNNNQVEYRVWDNSNCRNDYSNIMEFDEGEVSSGICNGIICNYAIVKAYMLRSGRDCDNSGDWTAAPIIVNECFKLESGDSKMLFCGNTRVESRIYGNSNCFGDPTDIETIYETGQCSKENRYIEILECTNIILEDDDDANGQDGVNIATCQSAFVIIINILCFILYILCYQ